MRVFQRLSMASAAAVGAGNALRTMPLALLPPIPLYRRILRAHRKLPSEMRVLGDEYVKAEFKAHKTSENPVHIIGFLTEWQLYAQAIEGESWRGEKMDLAKFQKMSDEQIAQLHELMQAIRNQELEENEIIPTPDK